MRFGVVAGTCAGLLVLVGAGCSSATASEPDIVPNAVRTPDPSAVVRRFPEADSPHSIRMFELVPTDGEPRSFDTSALAGAGTFGPFQDDAFHPAPDCEWLTFSADSEYALGTVGYPAGRVTGPTALDISIQVSSTTPTQIIGGGSHSRPAILVVNATPGEIVSAEFGDGHSDHMKVPESGIAVLFGTDGPQPSGATGASTAPSHATVSGLDAHGDASWHATSTALTTVALSRPDAPCLPPAAEPLGVSAG